MKRYSREHAARVPASSWGSVCAASSAGACRRRMDELSSGVRRRPTSSVRPSVRLEAANRPDYASLTPHQIVPKLADEGVYLASESTFYRVLKATGQGQRRGRARAPQQRTLTTHCARGPNQVWCWDITWMPTTIRGRYFYWYMMKDIYSRKLVMNEMWEQESAEHASVLLARGCLREGIAGRPLVLHSDSNNVSTSFSTARPSRQWSGCRKVWCREVFPTA